MILLYDFMVLCTDLLSRFVAYEILLAGLKSVWTGMLTNLSYLVLGDTCNTIPYLNWVVSPSSCSAFSIGLLDEMGA